MASGTLTPQIRKPTSSKWVSNMCTCTDNCGEYEFNLRPDGKFPKGTRNRAVLSDCGWCTDALTVAGRFLQTVSRTRTPCAAPVHDRERIVSGADVDLVPWE